MVLDCIVFWLDIFVFVIELLSVFVYDDGKWDVIKLGYNFVVEFGCMVINGYCVILCGIIDLFDFLI